MHVEFAKAASSVVSCEQWVFAASDCEPEADVIDAKTEEALRSHHQLTAGEGPNESLLALVDTACTSCMHSRKWREAYAKSLPPGYQCIQTDRTKVFHFADGSSTSTKVNVWKIPIFFANRPGMVMSAEIETGTTPLLLSISALVALDAVLFMRKKLMRLEELKLELDLLETGTKHLAVRVAFDGDKPAPENPENPIGQSMSNDLFVYYGQEATFPLMFCEAPVAQDDVHSSCKVQFGHRGIRSSDTKGEVNPRRLRELAKAMKQIRVEDSRTWVALKREYSLAEQSATLGFSTTVIFEPFGGRFGTTRVASAEWGWTNSQPLDLVDGYDLLGKTGQGYVFNTLRCHRPFLVLIAFDCRIWSLLCNLSSGVDWDYLRSTIGRKTLELVRDICKYQFQQGRFYLVENPVGSAAWIFRGILQRLLSEFGGKFAIGDQCPFGKVDPESRKPEQKKTGWLSNSEVILNFVCKRCSCPAGAHQQVIGNNSMGRRSKQAAEYPLPLCRAICRGVLKEMELMYVLNEVRGAHAFPLMDDDEDMEEMQMEEVSFEDSMDIADSWSLDEVNLTLTRHHVIPRNALFIPLVSMDPPVTLDRLSSRRTVIATNVGEAQEFSFEDDWTGAEAGRNLDRPWTGRTIFHLSPLELMLPEEPAVAEKPVQKTLRRRRVRTRQLQRGAWSVCIESQVKNLVDMTFEVYESSGSAGGWIVIDLNTDVGKAWKSLESAQAEIRLILASKDARRLRKPQPHAQPGDVPLRKTVLWMSNQDILSTGWEDWQQLAPSSQLRPLPNQPRKFCIVLFGCQIGADEFSEAEAQADPPDPLRHKEEERQRKWQALPRELKLALQRIHINLGHARLPDMLRALRVSRASEVALKACRLFRCKECPRLLEPKHPRPSRLPQVGEFNVVVGLDVLSEKDSNGDEWTWLNVVDEGTGFQVCCLLSETFKNPNSSEIIRAFEVGWCGWAGMPEKGLIVDRAKYFLASLAQRMTEEGCHVDAIGKASPWQFGFVERAGGVWKSTLRKMVWSEQLAGREDMMIATGAVNWARNNLARRSGFSPAQWVLGRSIRLPADVCEEAEVARIGAQSAAETPTTRFFRKSQLRMAAREAFMKASNDSALRRAELRKIRPTRGPFRIGDYVFFYDQADTVAGPNHWRGVARVVGREGSRIVWLSHRGLLVAASPEHLSHANEDEIHGWMVTSNETSLMDAMPAAGGTGFLDIRSKPAPPPEGFPAEDPDDAMPDAPTVEPEPPAPPAAIENEVPKDDDLSASSTSAARLELESERERKRHLKSYEFFGQKRAEREAKKARKQLETVPEILRREALDVPVGPTYDPDIDDFHQQVPTVGAPPIPEATGDLEAQEREAKRQRVTQPEVSSVSRDDAGSSSFCFLAMVEEQFLEGHAKATFEAKSNAYHAEGIDEETFLFGVERNDFQDQYASLFESAHTAQQAEAVKKKSRKEIQLKDLDSVTRRLFEGDDGSDQKEWNAWLQKDACEVLSLEESKRVLREKPQNTIPTRWVRTNKNDMKPDEPFFAKSRLVVQGFKDRSLGQYRRDAPTGSALAESLVLFISAAFGFSLVCKDIKNAYFSGRELGRELYLIPPRGGLPGVKPGQILRAKKAIYGFAEAARLFWLALRDHLVSDGWVESRLEPALFYLREPETMKIKGILVTHVDDIQAGIDSQYMEGAFAKSSMALEFATNHYDSYTFRGREIKMTAGGHIDVTMNNYVRSMKPVKISKERRRHLEARLTSDEKELLQSSAGELGWVARQLRCDLAFENGCIQRSKADPCIADLVRLRAAVSSARRAADFRQRFWSDVDPYEAVLVILADSGHANGTPENDSIMKYRSVGGYFLMLANPGVLEGKAARANMMAYQSSQTKRVCRSTLAAEASHLSSAVEAGDWLSVLLAECLEGDIDLKNWDKIVEARRKIYVTDAQSVFDYLQKESNSTSSDKRMAIEGALLRETVRRPGAFVRWIDGEQNIADILTKVRADQTTLFQYLRDGLICLTQTEANRKSKEQKRQQRTSRKKVLREDPMKQKVRDDRIKQLASEMSKLQDSSDECEQANKEK